MNLVDHQLELIVTVGCHFWLVQQRSIATVGTYSYFWHARVRRRATQEYGHGLEEQQTDFLCPTSDDLRRRLKDYRRIHMICDNATFHESRAVQKYLEQWRQRIELHFLPTDAPETNPIERVWWPLHETVTRNHPCTAIEELLTEVYDWFAAGQFFPIEISLDRLAA